MEMWVRKETYQSQRLSIRKTILRSESRRRRTSAAIGRRSARSVKTELMARVWWETPRRLRDTSQGERVGTQTGGVTGNKSANGNRTNETRETGAGEVRLGVIYGLVPNYARVERERKYAKAGRQRISDGVISTTESLSWPRLPVYRPIIVRDHARWPSKRPGEKRSAYEPAISLRDHSDHPPCLMSLLEAPFHFQGS